MTAPLLYFAYGANLNRRAMARRCPRAEIVALTVAGVFVYAALQL